ncbi:hypothetical protein [Advenella mimigardefordensis]|uniref:Uncharacterized protein n=1 Tax=Advenella mimigardefordensis (strain DSM 17166 / LMG 22922 / DPN7) TaxID=1247726 RepID=W0P8V7_ADVMD|nr:hypothetical protein [Advenella mimigardefordensis]AHG63156.1 hypothetical protein MIM_c10580 [Advenella mimigardefordensis DPN7]
MQITIFSLPNGTPREVEITNVNPIDAEFFEHHKVKISMEDIGGMFAVYADIGKVHDGEPDELIELSQGRSCEDTLNALRLQCEEALREMA